jgi:hypothetical protein
MSSNKAAPLNPIYPEKRVHPDKQEWVNKSQLVRLYLIENLQKGLEHFPFEISLST